MLLWNLLLSNWPVFGVTPMQETGCGVWKVLSTFRAVLASWTSSCLYPSMLTLFYLFTWTSEITDWLFADWCHPPIPRVQDQNTKPIPGGEAHTGDASLPLPLSLLQPSLSSAGHVCSHGSGVYRQWLLW